MEGDEVLALNGTAAGDLPGGSVMLTITDNDMITYTLSGAADLNIAEGKSAVLPATASSALVETSPVGVAVFNGAEVGPRLLLAAVRAGVDDGRGGLGREQRPAALLRRR